MVHFTGVVFYAIFASGEKQPWADPPHEPDTWRPEPTAVTDDTTGKLTSYGAVGKGEVIYFQKHIYFAKILYLVKQQD